VLLIDDEAGVPACLLYSLARFAQALVELARRDVAAGERPDAVIARVVAFERQSG